MSDIVERNQRYFSGHRLDLDQDNIDLYRHMIWYHNRPFYQVEVDKDIDINMCVLEDLPKFQNKNCDEWIQTRYQKAHATDPQQPIVDVLDIGCGTGRALANLEYYRRGVRGFGITNQVFLDNNDQLVLHSHADRYYVDDATNLITNLEEGFPGQRYDIIYSNKAFMQMRWPFLDLVQQAYALTKPEGLGFFNHSSTPNYFARIKGHEWLLDWFQKNNYLVEFQKHASEPFQFAGISYQKTQPQILVPVEYLANGSCQFSQSLASYYSQLLKQ